MKSLIFSLFKPFLALYCKIQAFSHRIRLNLVKLKFKSFGENSDFASHVVFKGRECISVGANTRIDSFTLITAWTEYRGTSFSSSIVIGDNCYIAPNTHITAINKITIGDNALIGRCVTITDNSHGQLVADQLKMSPAFRPLYSKGEVVIGKNVWICDKATITAGVTIGDGCIIAANAVVTKSVPPYSLVAGNPARVIKTINKEA